MKFLNEIRDEMADGYYRKEEKAVGHYKAAERSDGFEDGFDAAVAEITRIAKESPTKWQMLRLKLIEEKGSGE